MKLLEDFNLSCFEFYKKFILGWNFTDNQLDNKKDFLNALTNGYLNGIREKWKVSIEPMECIRNPVSNLLYKNYGELHERIVGSGTLIDFKDMKNSNFISDVLAINFITKTYKDSKIKNKLAGFHNVGFYLGIKHLTIKIKNVCGDSKNKYIFTTTLPEFLKEYNRIIDIHIKKINRR